MNSDPSTEVPSIAWHFMAQYTVTLYYVMAFLMLDGEHKIIQAEGRLTGLWCLHTNEKNMAAFYIKDRYVKPHNCKCMYSKMGTYCE